MKTLQKLIAVTVLVALTVNLSCDNQDQESGKSITEIDGLKMSEVTKVWKFKTDPKNVGREEKWYTSQTDDSAWAEIRSDKNSGWESQGFPDYIGHGWYRQRVKVPAEMDTQKPFYLCFAAVDEDAVIYINGEKAFEHTTASTGLEPDEIWITSFAFDARKWLRAGQENLIAVRVYNRARMGGIWKPVYFVTSDTEATAGKVAELVEEEIRPGYTAPGMQVPPMMARGSYELPKGVVLDTLVLGGVDPSAEQLAAMHRSNYILHARDGKLSEIPVEKSRLPHDPE